MRIQRQSETFAYRHALKYEVPKGISVTTHGILHSNKLANEVLQQDGPAILWKAFKGDRFPGDKFYVARGEDNTIHGVLKGNWSKNHFHISDLYSSLKAPPGTGNYLLKTVAQEAQSQGKGLKVQRIINNARTYWESMGAQTQPGSSFAEWSPEGLHGLVSGDSIPAANTEGALSGFQTIPRAHRLPGSARQLAWGRRKLPRIAGENRFFVQN